MCGQAGGRAGWGLQEFDLKAETGPWTSPKGDRDYTGRVKQVVIEPVNGATRLLLLVREDVETVAVRYFRPETPSAVERVVFCPSGETVTDENGTFPLWKPLTH